MLTVIVSLRNSGMRSLDQLAHRVKHRAVHFLHLRARDARHVHVDIHHPSGLAAVAARQSDRPEAGLAGLFQSAIHVNVPSKATARVQEVHRTLLHVICAIVEESVVNGASTKDTKR